MKIFVTGGEMPQEEQEAYVQWAREKYGMEPVEMWLHIDGEYVDVETHLRKQPFERIRRVTGYLVGTLDRWNDGKRAEERDRVKHGMEGAGDADGE